MKKILFITIIASLICIQCGKKSDPFIIQNGSIGALSKEIKMNQIDSLYASDSIVRMSRIKDALGTQGDVEIYEKGGAKLLLLSPENENDPNSLISNIQIFDTRFKTEKGLHKRSTVKDIKTKYTISAIQTTIDAVVIFLEGSDIYITINKNQLPENLRYNPSLKVEASQIPDEAKFKYFMVGWDTITN